MTAKIIWLINFMISMVTLGGSADLSIPTPERDYVDAIYVEVGEIDRNESNVQYSVTCWVRNHTDDGHQVTVTIVGLGLGDSLLVSTELSGFVEARREIQFNGDGQVDVKTFMDVSDWQVHEVVYK